MQNIKIYTIGTEVKVGESKGVITAIKLLGLEYAVTYLVSWLVGSSMHERWLHDIEFTVKKSKITIGLKIIPEDIKEITPRILTDAKDK